jgi:hypothetical protein
MSIFAPNGASFTYHATRRLLGIGDDNVLMPRSVKVGTLHG